jgi:hypothetical protein
MPQYVKARPSASPDFSSARMVFSNDGGSELAAIASISASCIAMPSSSAGFNAARFILSKAGTPP